MGRAYTKSGMGLNVYLVVLAATGTGKNSAGAALNKLHSGIAFELHKQHQNIPVRVGPIGVASAQGVLRSSFRRTFAASLTWMKLGIGSNRSLEKMPTTTTRALLKPSSAYSASQAEAFAPGGIVSTAGNLSKSVAPLVAPVWSFIGNSVHEVFYESLSEKNVTDGLVGRLTLIERPVSQKLPDFNRAHKEVKLDPALVLYVTEMVKFAYGHEQQEEHSHNWIDVPMSPEAEQWDHVFVAMIQQKKEHHNQAQQGVLVGIWQRVRERTLKP